MRTSLKVKNTGYRNTADGYHRDQCGEQMTAPKSGAHEKLLDNIERRVEDWGITRQVVRDIKYPAGQLDLLVTTNNGRRIYVEAKSYNSNEGYMQAVKQILRAIDFKQCDEGLYVSRVGTHYIAKRVRKQYG